MFEFLIFLVIVIAVIVFIISKGPVALQGIGWGWSAFKFYLSYKAAAEKVQNNPNYSSKAEKIAYLNEYHSIYSYKGSIAFWITCWPISLLHYIFFDLLHDLGVWIYNKVAFIYSWIATKIQDRIFK